MRSSLNQSVLPVAVVMLLGAATSLQAGDVYIEADNGKEIDYGTGHAQYPFIVGQKGDLNLRIENIQWLTESYCEKDYIMELCFDVVYNWKVLRLEDAPLGATGQWENPSDADGPDTLWVGWQGDDYYLDPTKTTAGSTPQVGGGAFNEVRWDNVPETSGGNKTYRVGLKIKPKTPYVCEEDVPAVVVKATFIHTYDGDLHFSTSDTLDISVGLPLSISAGGSVSLQNDHAWYKEVGPQLISPPAGSKLNDYLLLGQTPPPECCPHPIPLPHAGTAGVAGILAIMARRAWPRRRNAHR